MSEFQTALAYAHDALAGLRDTGRKPVGTREVLQRLATTRTLSTAPAPARPGAATPPLDALRDIALTCRKCPHLAQSRTQVVFGTGNPAADLMFVGEAPGTEEDAQGAPFVGKAGQLLTRIIETMGLSRDSVYLANVLKCRPDTPGTPGDPSGTRRPARTEMETCLPYLREQIDIIQPKVLVALGTVALEGLLGSVEPVEALRGRWHSFAGIPLMATHHPSYLLDQSPAEKRKVWEDLLQVMERLDLRISDRQRRFFL